MASSLSFKFSKISRSKVQPDDKPLGTAQEEPLEIADELRSHKRQKIRSFDPSGFNGDEEIGDTKSSHQIVIPALKNTLNLSNKIGSNFSLDDLAKQTLLEDAEKFAAGKSEISHSNGAGHKNGLKIELMSDPLLAESSGEADYQSVPVDCFGTALLRGLGWNEGQPIGRTSKKTVKPWITEPRPKGLGLGARMSKPAATPQSDQSLGDREKTKNRGDLGFKKGAYVKILKAKIDNVGVIVSVGNDNARIFVKLPKKEEILNLSQYAVELLTKKEFEDASSSGPENKIMKNSRKSTEKSTQSVNSGSSEKTADSWLQIDLKIRLIDEKSYSGKYFKQKAVITDIVTQDTCNCLAENGKLLEGLHFSQLETVVPRFSPGEGHPAVMILRGPNKLQIGSLLDRDSKKNLAVVRILAGESEGEIFSMNFDDICEYVGDGLM